jgi:iron only hydrogenase large subunit-like protein
MKTGPIYTEASDCTDCYKCIRECPTKAIKVSGNKASVIDHLCVHCGHCVSICPSGAKKVRNGIARAHLLLKSKQAVYVSLAPSYTSEFPDMNEQQLISKLIDLGFKGVSETALGAELVSMQTASFLDGRDQGIYISSACPSVVEYICKYYPDLAFSLTPYLSPMVAHAKWLRQRYGHAIGVVFIGPCIGKKSEADDFPKLVDVALTFEELKNWLKKSDAPSRPPSTIKDCRFTPFEAQQGTIYPLDGGMVKSVLGLCRKNSHIQMSFSGFKQIQKVLDEISQVPPDKPLFLELLACEGGCINGPGITNEAGLTRKKADLFDLKSARQCKAPLNFENSLVNIERDFFNIRPSEANKHSSEAIKEALHSIGKTSIQDELNCSGCGYDSCRDFASALLSNHAETDMCVSYMRHVAHNKASILLKKIPSGAVIVNDSYKVLEMNKSFTKMMGEEFVLCYEANPGLKGMHIDSTGAFARFFKTALTTGKEMHEVAVTYNKQRFQLSIFNIQKHKLVAGIIQCVHLPEFRKDIVEKQTREVIQKNMETVQKIAHLLGENASYTDSLLNSILDAHTETDA